jgi:hypothetical protein
MMRSAESQAQYDAHVAEKLRRGDTTCDICTGANERALPIKIGGKVLEIANIAKMENDFPYRVKDGQEVLDHHMLASKGHYAEIFDYPGDTLQDYVFSLAVSLHESGQYSEAFIRTPESRGSSIKDHAHTHLVKMGRLVIAMEYSRNDGINLVQFEGEDKLHPL